MRWNKISALSFSTALSAAQFQPLAPGQWPSWAQGSTKITGAWATVDGGPLAISTDGLSTSSGQTYVDMERIDQHAPHNRNYRYVHVQTEDGRIFESTPLKNLEYKRHFNDRPEFISTHATESSS